MREAHMGDLSLLAAPVRAARGLLGWSQAYLAEGINVRRATMTDFENGKHELREAIGPIRIIRYPSLKPKPQAELQIRSLLRLCLF
jgi:DNA-binding XRE family transcriptional regulator